MARPDRDPEGEAEGVAGRHHQDQREPWASTQEGEPCGGLERAPGKRLERVPVSHTAGREPEESPEQVPGALPGRVPEGHLGRDTVTRQEQTEQEANTKETETGATTLNQDREGHADLKAETRLGRGRESLTRQAEGCSTEELNTRPARNTHPRPKEKKSFRPIQ